MKKLSKKQTLSYLALQKVARLQELLKLTQNAEVVTSCDNYTPEAYKQKTHYLKKSSGRIKLNRKIEITCLLKTIAKLLVFSELAKLISNF